MLNSDNSFTIKCNIVKTHSYTIFFLMRPFSQNDVVFSNADDFVFLLGYYRAYKIPFFLMLIFPDG